VREMVNGPETSKQELEESKENWKENALLNANKLRELKNKALNNDTKKDKPDGLESHFDDRTDWGEAIKKYLFAEANESQQINRIKFAAKLATVNTDAEKKLITAIELGRNGYVILSLTTISQLIEQSKLGREDRLDACAIVIENIISNSNKIHKDLQLNTSQKDWLYTARLIKQFTKLLSIIIELHQNQESLEKLSSSLKELINTNTIETATQAHEQERKTLDHVAKRRLITKQLSRIHKKTILRSIHHLACTGGTLFGKCLASMPNVALISEVNPMNRHGGNFAPSNPLLLLEKSYREFSTEEKINSFKLQIKDATKICQQDDVDLILRDHSHTDFYYGEKESKACPIYKNLRDEYDLISVVTVRHPLDSYISLNEKGWITFDPGDLNEYCRRYLAFLDEYSSLEIYRYEDFCEDPTTIMQQLCDHLKIDYDPDFINNFGSQQLTGDSGRKGVNTIEKRPRKQVSKEIDEQIDNAEHYVELLNRLKY